MPARLTTIAGSPIRAFAEKHRLKVVTDKGDGTAIVRGRHGQLFEYGNSLALMCICEGAAKWTPKKYGNARRACEAAGMIVLQDGDCEGSLMFDHRDGTQAKLAIKVTGCKAKRVLDPARKEDARARMTAYWAAKRAA